jgi:hypothetical protein
MAAFRVARDTRRSRSGLLLIPISQAWASTSWRLKAGAASEVGGLQARFIHPIWVT